MQLSQKQKAYWRTNLRVTTALLLIWFIVTFVASYFARELNSIEIFGFPLGFYMGAQGSPFIYLSIVWYYARFMNKLDEKYGIADEDA